MPTLAEQVAALEAERDAAIVSRRKYIDRLNETLRERESLIARLASARVEGAREFVERYVSRNTSDANSDTFFRYLQDLERFRDREYPAHSAPAGEQTRPVCVLGATCRNLGLEQCNHCATQTRPAPTPEPERLMLAVWNGVGDTPERYVVEFTPGDCRRIVALGSRPTQTAEG